MVLSLRCCPPCVEHLPYVVLHRAVPLCLALNDTRWCARHMVLAHHWPSHPPRYGCGRCVALRVERVTCRVAVASWRCGVLAAPLRGATCGTCARAPAVCACAVCREPCLPSSGLARGPGRAPARRLPHRPPFCLCGALPINLDVLHVVAGTCRPPRTSRDIYVHVSHVSESSPRRVRCARVACDRE